ncbi:MAG: GAF domain-containing protein [Anaerolineae bacterium]|nr:GAF domain-containing protein [Anaerolineae bacterium]
MFNSISRFFRLPEAGGQVEQLRRSLLNTIVLSVIVLAPLTSLLMAFFGAASPLQNAVIFAGIAAGLFALFLYWLLRQGQDDVAGWLALLLLFVITTLVAVSDNGVRSTLIFAYILIVVVSSLVLAGPRATAISVALPAVALVVLYLLEATGVLAYSPGPLRFADLLLPVIVLLLVGILVSRLARALIDAIGRARASEAALANANEKLGALNQELEARVIARTRALALSSEISRRLSTILDQRQLVDEIINQLRQAFNYYHVHVYLLSERGDEMILAGGTGEAGAVMLERGHKLALDQGLVGRAGSTRLPILAPDVQREPAWLPNPLLPQTKSEIAVPIVLGDELLGVLDVQHDMAGGLGAEDVDLLATIANQAAVGLQNARLYAAAQQDAEREILLNTISQRIQSTTSVEQALQVAVRELGRVLPGQEAAVRLRPERRAVEER